VTEAAVCRLAKRAMAPSDWCSERHRLRRRMLPIFWNRSKPLPAAGGPMTLIWGCAALRHNWLRRRDRLCRSRTELAWLRARGLPRD